MTGDDPLHAEQVIRLHEALCERKVVLSPLEFKLDLLG